MNGMKKDIRVIEDVNRGAKSESCMIMSEEPSKKSNVERDNRLLTDNEIRKFITDLVVVVTSQTELMERMTIHLMDMERRMLVLEGRIGKKEPPKGYQ